ncbi:MAG: hemerythrin family protein [bacterium]|nr:hemerythrin family protein [bacterium]
MKHQFDWDEKLSTGIPWIDSQHKKLLHSFNTLLNVVITKEDYVQVSKVIKFLQGYVKAHFQTEEKFMLQSNYHGYNTQKKKHAEFEIRVEEIKEEYDKQGPTEEFVKKTANEIWLWYKNHISTCDREFAEYLKSKNLVKIDEDANDLFNELLEGIET